MFRRVTLALLVLLGVVSGLMLLIWWGQERILFQPPSFSGYTGEPGRVEYEATDGQKLAGYIVGDPKTARGTLVCFHGNADLSFWQLDWGREVHERTGYAVFMAEYRGYMALGGTPSYETTKLDAQAAYDHLRKLGADTSMLAYYGHSLGTGVAAELAEKHPPRSLVLQSPFTSAEAMARLIVSPPLLIAWRSVSRIHFDTREIVTKLDVPVFIAHGTRDRIIPVRMGRELHAAARSKGELLIVEGAGHNDVADVAGEDYWKWLAEGLK